MKPHPQAAHIKDWADGYQMQQRRANLMLSSMPPQKPAWEAFDGVWRDGMEYRRKPKAPVKTTMTEDEAEEVFRSNMGYYSSVIETGISRAIDDGQVVACDHEVVVMGRANRTARDMAVAKAVFLGAMDYVSSHGAHGTADYYRQHMPNLAAIIAKVPK